MPTTKEARMRMWPRRIAAVSFSATVIAAASLGAAPAYAQPAPEGEPSWLAKLVSDCPDL